MNMHLHGHLLSCIEDYGPVYAFWCFAYERLNGVLGTYHTNNHNISAQLMRRFLDSKAYSPNKWPEDYVADFLPLLEKFRYHKGSLMQTTLETQLDFGEVHDLAIQPLPPMQEYTLTEEEMSQIEPHFRSSFNQPFRVLVLCQKVKAVKVSDYVISGHSSRHSGSPIVLAKRNSSVDLAEIMYFVECIAVSKG